MAETRTIRIAGISVACTDSGSTRKHALVKHEYAGVNGGDVENLGTRIQELKLTAVFVGEKGLAEWDQLEDLFKTGATVVVEHFQLGEVSAKIESLDIKIDRRKETVEVDFSILEDGVESDPVPVPPSAQDVVASAAQEIADAATDSTADQFLPSAIPAPDLSSPTWFEQLGDLGSKLNDLVAGIRLALGRLDGLIATFSYPVTNALSALSFAADLPSQLSLRLATVLDLMQGRVAGAADPGASAARFLRDAAELADTFRGSPIEGQARTMAALQGARTVATLLATDEDRLRAMQAYESEDAFDARGHWVGKAAAPKSLPTSATQMAYVIGLARQLIQSARPWIEDASVLDRVAVALQDQFNDRLVQFERLREIMIAEPTPLHLVCHRNGLPYNAAERVALLNPQIRNPTFTQGKVLIYAPA
jgi:prophage DNA circulation protein